MVQQILVDNGNECLFLGRYALNTPRWLQGSQQFLLIGLGSIAIGASLLLSVFGLIKSFRMLLALSFLIYGTLMLSVWKKSQQQEQE